MAFKKTFQLETGAITLSDEASGEQATKISIAVSLKRIADAFEKNPPKTGHVSVFEEIFGKQL